MRVLVIPDIHLKPWMFDRADELLKQGIADKTICLMDIPDDWGQESNLDLYTRTFDRAIRFQKDHPDQDSRSSRDLSYIYKMKIIWYYCSLDLQDMPKTTRHL